MSAETAATTEKVMTKRTPPVAKIVEIIGVPNKGWDDAAQLAIDEAKKIIRNIHGIKIQDMTADVYTNTGRITR
jgi:dodecin